MSVFPPSFVYPVVLSGGSGTRLWPLSRELFPKQLRALVSEKTMLQATLGRVSGEQEFAAPIIICNHQHCFIVDEQVRSLGIDDHLIVAEPIGRNTAPAVAAAALLVEPDAILLVMPSDHDIGNQANFQKALEIAIPAARAGHLVTFGVVPTAPETGLGYIRRGASLDQGQSFVVDRFVEKPSAEIAAQYVESGEYYWNAGIFAFRADVYLAELERTKPELLAKTRQAVEEARRDNSFLYLSDELFREIEGDSIDYAVMEKTSKAAVVPVDMDWSDLGSWSALWQRSPQDEQGNALIGDAIAVDCSGSYLRSDHGLVAGLGLKDMVVVATTDAVLVADKARSQDVKKVVEKLNALKRPQATDPFQVHRPWGWFQTVDIGGRFKVKHIMVKPGYKLSLQKHYHRSEHWIVVAGVGLVTCGEEVTLLRENQSTYIPAGEVHRLENPGKTALRLIEVQSGDYLGEDDIVRFDDAYGRADGDGAKK